MYYDENVQGGGELCMQLGGKELKAGKGSSPPNAGVGQVEQSLLMLEMVALNTPWCWMEKGRTKCCRDPIAEVGKGSHKRDGVGYNAKLFLCACRVRIWQEARPAGEWS